MGRVFFYTFANKFLIVITSAQIKFVKSLSQKKFRKELGLFVVEGDKMVKELLSHPHWHTEMLFALDGWLQSNPARGSHQTFAVSEKELARISNLQTPNQALAVVRQRSQEADTKLLKGNFCLLLDQIQDPGNLGTIIRTADWFGIRHIFCSEDTAELYNPKVIQATMGSFARVDCLYVNLQNMLKALPHPYPVMAALLEGENIYSTRLPSEGVLMIGNEARGISPTLLPFVTHKLHIPISRPEGKTQFPESLNASVASAILLSHLKKK